jgi:DNA-binding FadR family transcriptional regulator
MNSASQEHRMPIKLPSDLLRYLGERKGTPGERLPPIPHLAQDLGISTGKLREQLEVAREFGLVEVRPKTGTRCQAYSFFPPVRTSLLFSMALDPGYFDYFRVLRNHLESAFWSQAVEKLRPGDISLLGRLVQAAWRKLRGNPIRVPHAEHRDLHKTIFSRLENPFVRGILDAYWDAYEAIGLNLYTEYDYLNQVWSVHERVVQAIAQGDFEGGHRALVEHFDLFYAHPGAGRMRAMPTSSASHLEMGEDQKGEGGHA